MMTTITIMATETLLLPNDGKGRQKEKKEKHISGQKPLESAKKSPLLFISSPRQTREIAAATGGQCHWTS